MTLQSKSLEILDRIVIHNNGAVQCRVQISIVVFKPAVGTVLEATLDE